MEKLQREKMHELERDNQKVKTHVKLMTFLSDDLKQLHLAFAANDNVKVVNKSTGEPKDWETWCKALSADLVATKLLLADKEAMTEELCAPLRELDELADNLQMQCKTVSAMRWQRIFS